MSRDPELAHRLRLAIDEERETASLVHENESNFAFAALDAAREATDALVEQLATP